jgi:hypothetical protein
MDDQDRTASLMTPAKLAQVKPKGPVSPAAWLDQMATDAGYPHVSRLAELCKDLQAQARRRDVSQAARDLARVAERLPRLDFGLLQSRGWLARVSGKTRTAGAEFAGQYRPIEDAVAELVEELKDLRKRQGAPSTGADIALVETEVEFRALEKIIDQGARWLQDMRNQLKVREAAKPSPAERGQIDRDAARCEILVARLKALRAASSGAQQAHQQAQSTAARHAALIEGLQQALANDVKEWRQRVGALASVVSEGNPPVQLEAAMECHRDLQLCVKQLIADCGQLQAHEKTLDESLGALASQLQAAGA